MNTLGTCTCLERRTEWRSVTAKSLSMTGTVIRGREETTYLEQERIVKIVHCKIRFLLNLIRVQTIKCGFFLFSIENQV